MKSIINLRVADIYITCYIIKFFLLFLKSFDNWLFCLMILFEDTKFEV